MNFAGGNSAVGHSIPVPVVRSNHFAWAQKRWAAQPIVWPATPPRFAPLTVATHLLLALLLLASVAGFVLFSWQYLIAPVEHVNRQLALGAIVLEIAIVMGATILRRVNIAVGFARLLLLFFALTAALGLAFSGLLFLRIEGAADQFTLIPFVANLPLLVAGVLFVALAIAVWNLLNDQVSSFAHWRGNVIVAARTVFPDGMRERRFAAAPVVLHEESGELERRLAVAERLSAPLLDQLLIMPGVTIVDGIAFPGSRTAHVGHAVVAGNKIALIDSLLWMPGQYVLDAWGRVVRDGKIDEHVDVTTAIAAQRYAADRPQLEFGSWAVVHRLADAPITIASEPQNAVRLVTPEDLVREVGEWLAPVGEQVDTFALQFAVNARLA